MAPSLCGPLINSKRSFLALVWTLTTLLSVFSFGVSVYLATRINQQYNSMATGGYAEWFSNEYMQEYNNDWGNCRHLEGGGGQQREGEEGQHDREDGERNKDEEEHDREGCHSELDAEFFEALASANSRSLEFAGVYTTVLGIALSLYGSTVVVGFMSLKGEYIPPCFSFRSMSLEDEVSVEAEDATTGPRKLWGEKIHRGIFLGCLVIFSNLCLLCAVIFGELKVRDNYNNYAQENNDYQIERISSFFAITCIVLASAYVLFAVIYMTCGGMSDEDTVQPTNGEWLDHSQFQMSPPGKSRRRRRSRRDQLPNARDKSEPLVSAIGGMTGAEGFITEMISTSSGSSQGSYVGGERRYELT
eukprot:CCRYP_007546-RA/>CCRYP_007546-RA protein AED:0.06 eAED:0.06 QI:296/1/1/1/0.5/0.33/3/236/359